VTVRPLTEPFALRSDLARCNPWQVPFARLAGEVAAELQRRREAYAHRRADDAETRADRDRHLAAWAVIADDLTRDAAPMRAWPADRAQAVGPLACLPYTRPAMDDGPAYALDWPTRVRELRRELALRRAQYPRRIARPTDILTADAAATALEAIDAAHWRVWAGLAGFTPPGIDPADDMIRHRWVAARTIARLTATWEAAPDPFAALLADAFHATWTDIGRLARHCEDGGTIAAATDCAARARLLGAAEAVLEDTLAHAATGSEREAEVAQLTPLVHWLRHAALRPGRALTATPVAVIPERIAA